MKSHTLFFVFVSLAWLTACGTAGKPSGHPYSFTTGTGVELATTGTAKVRLINLDDGAKLHRAFPTSVTILTMDDPRFPHTGEYQFTLVAPESTDKHFFFDFSVDGSAIEKTEGLRISNFLVLHDSRLIAVTFYDKRFLRTQSYRTIEGDASNLKESMTNFASHFDGQEYDKWTRVPTGQKANFARLYVGNAVAPWFFAKVKSPLSYINYQPQITGLEITGDVLRIDLLNEHTKSKATLWIDWPKFILLRSVYDGQEVDLKNPNFFSPEQNQPVP